MTAPRQVLPGSMAMITRRCTQRQFLLRPDVETNRIFNYCLAESSRRFDIGLIAWVAMSNHYHAVVHDPKGQLPAFIEHLHKMLARVLNVRWGRRENLWSTESTCVVYLKTEEDLLQKVIYILANPFANYVVDRAHDWPGSSSLDYMTGRSTTHQRPKLFFREDGDMPAEVELRAIVPPEVAATTRGDSWARTVLEALTERESRVRETRLRDGHSIVGRREVLQASPFETPSTTERTKGGPPRISARNRSNRARLLDELTTFLTSYAAARRLFATGHLNVEFPAGTYRMRLLGARCAAPIPIAVTAAA